MAQVIFRFLAHSKFAMCFLPQVLVQNLRTDGLLGNSNVRDGLIIIITHPLPTFLSEKVLCVCINENKLTALFFDSCSTSQNSLARLNLIFGSFYLIFCFFM